MNGPHVAGWNLALRLSLEIGALVSLGWVAWTWSTGVIARALWVAYPIAVAIAWGGFSILNDLDTRGWIRFALELLILFGGAIAVGITAGGGFGIGFALLIALHYTASRNRVRWIIGS